MYFPAFLLLFGSARPKILLILKLACVNAIILPCYLWCNDHHSNLTIIFYFMLSVLPHYVYFKTTQSFILIIIFYSGYSNQR